MILSVLLQNAQEFRVVHATESPCVWYIFRTKISCCKYDSTTLFHTALTGCCSDNLKLSDVLRDCRRLSDSRLSDFFFFFFNPPADGEK